MAYTQITLEGTVLLANGDPAAGAVVTIELNEAISDGSSIVAPRPIQATCAGDGTFDLGPVNANDDGTTSPQGTSYVVTITRGGSPLFEPWNVSVPSAGGTPQNLLSLDHVSNTLPAQPVVTSVNGMNGNVTVPFVSLDSPAFTGTPTAPTASPLTDDTQLATTAYADAAVAASITAGKITPTAVKTSAYAAAVNQLVPCNASGGPFTITLPTAPADKSLVGGINVVAPGSNVVTFAAGGSDVINFAGTVTDTLKVQGEVKIFQYDAAAAIWYEISGTPVAKLSLYILASAALTGTPTAPTATPLTDTTQVATTAYADAAVAAQHTADAALFLLVSEAGVASGVATLDASALVPAVEMRPFNYRGALTSGMSLNPWDVVLYKGGRVLITTAVTVGTFSSGFGFISSADYVAMGSISGTVIQASDYGVVGDGTTDNGATLNNLIKQVSVNGGGDIYLPPGNVDTSIPIVLQTGVHLWGTSINTVSTLRLLAGANCDVVQTFKSTGSGVSNAFFCGLWNIQLHGNEANQSPTDWHYGINSTTNPLTSQQTGDPDFDPSHIFVNVWIKSTSGHGYFNAGRSGNRLIGVWTELTGGDGFESSFDTDYIACHAELCGLAGFYVNHASTHGSGNKSYNNGTAVLWTTAQNWAAGAYAIDNGALYRAANALTNDTTAPHLDSTNWTSVWTVVYQAGVGFFYDSAASEAAWAGSDAQQNATWNYYLKGVTGVNVFGTSAQPNCNTATGVNNSANAGDYAALCLDGAIGNVVILTAQAMSPAAYVIRSVNGSTRNKVIISGDQTASATVSPDSTALLGSGNNVEFNGVSLTATLAALNDVSITSPQNNQALAYNSTTGKWQNASGVTVFDANVFGNGSDGAITFDGTTTYSAFATTSGTAPNLTYTLKRNVQATTIVISAGIQVNPLNCIFQYTTSFVNNGTISLVGNSASGTNSSTAGAATTNGSVWGNYAPGAAGGAGQTGAGSAGSNSAFRAAGGSAGTGGAGGVAQGTAGGAAGTVGTTSTAITNNVQALLSGVGYNPSVAITGPISGGCGGGGGAGDGTNKGGGGGGGGGCSAAFGPSFTNSATGVITVAGGNGGSPSSVVGGDGCGGGGGGSGGLFVVVTTTAWTQSGTLTTTAGQGGTAAGTGANGNNGAAGNILNVVIV